MRAGFRGGFIGAVAAVAGLLLVAAPATAHRISIRDRPKIDPPAPCDANPHAPCKPTAGKPLPHCLDNTLVGTQPEPSLAQPCTPRQAPQPLSKNFRYPQIRKSNRSAYTRLDACMAHGAHCDQPVADAFCASQDNGALPHGSRFVEAPGLNLTLTLGSHQYCNANCTGFALIVCAK